MSARRLLMPALAGRDDLAGRHEVDEAARRHLLKVLRASDGDPLEIVPGDGRLLAGLLSLTSRGGAFVDELKLLAREAPRPPITLAAAVIKGKRMDWLVEKVAEAGVDVLLPWEAERSVVRLGDRRDDERTSRWQAIMDGASRQCERLWRPHVLRPTQGIQSALAAVAGAGECLVVADEALRSSAFPAADAPKGPWVLLTGPEGGFTEHERACFAAHPRVLRVGLGRRLLRAETAALVLTARWSALVESEGV
ncbi:MAG: 16S rRNA (uracil(1498)-N(3))-methyltransferase [Deltaproteobacteria bacterium]|nr:MAG: 16S rRNA (uracil(1498)-N(3))-methyltransferase [Deltaproteobacteria bacterium]